LLLPVHTALSALLHALRAGTSAVLQAPPGAGKTTVVPLELLGESWLGSGRVVMLEPRRLAARLAAQHMAHSLGESVGKTVGYRVRMDTRVGPRTRVEVVTEGVLTRMLQRDPAIEGTGIVIFDEFHERSLHADLGLALVLQTQELLRPELRILVMSATLDGTRVAQLLGGMDGPAPVIEARGRQFPVEVRHRPRPGTGWGVLEASVASAVIDTLVQVPDGDILVFLPGVAEIRRTINELDQRLGSSADSARNSTANVDILPLHGTLPQEAQDRAVQPAPTGHRRVVLATSIAETSLTIVGVRAVVDAGFSRVPRFSPRTGMTRLETLRVSRAAAEQRCGRAGRIEAGVCIRLWPEQEHHGLIPHLAPEILEADLAPLALELAAAGIGDPASLRWLDIPPPGALAQARGLLRQLGALDISDRIAAHGSAMAGLGLHPRLAHMLLVARETGDPQLAWLACELAALVQGRDPLRAERGPPEDPDVRLRISAIRAPRQPSIAGHRVDHEIARRLN